MNTGGQAEKEAEPSDSLVLALLDRIAAGERLTSAAAAMGLSEDQVSAIFSKAAEIVRLSRQETYIVHQGRKPPPQGRREMTVADALEILGGLSAGRHTESS